MFHGENIADDDVIAAFHHMYEFWRQCGVSTSVVVVVMWFLLE